MGEYKDRLQSAMKEANVSIAMLAKELKISYQAVKKVLDGKTATFDAANHAKAARYLKRSPDWLLDGTTPVAVEGEKLPIPLSPQAVELAKLFDMLTDRIKRTVAYNAATEAILIELQEHGPAPNDKPGRAAKSRKQRA
jgi:hypothetical protein